MTLNTQNKVHFAAKRAERDRREDIASRWTAIEGALASLEGWGVTGGVIVRVTDADKPFRFESVGEARAHVSAEAKCGSSLHMRAIRATMTDEKRAHAQAELDRQIGLYETMIQDVRSLKRMFR